MKNSSMGWKIFGLFVSIALIVGGLSGELVLRGTDSSEALVVVGVLFLIWDIVSIATHKKKPEIEESNVEANGELLSDGLSADVHHLEKVQIDEMNNQAGASLEASLPTPPNYSGAQWFFKVLRHYADFSGRARRTEYWMFMLFYLIFFLAWSFLIGLIVGLTRGNNETLVFVLYIFPLTLMLPSMAVTVRRLHDLGKSGWMVLVSLIPLIGSIWLFVLTVLEGEAGENIYGPNPKIWQKPLNDKIKLKNVAITLIVATCFSILGYIMLLCIQYVNYDFVPNIFIILSHFVYSSMFIVGGVLLLSAQTIYDLREKGKHAFLLILISTVILFLVSVFFLIQNLQNGMMQFSYGQITIMGNIIVILLCLSIAVFVISHLYMKQNRSLVSMAAICMIVMVGLYMLSSIIMLTAQSGDIMVDSSLFEMFRLLFPVAFLLLAWTYLSGKESTPVSVKVALQGNERVTAPRFEGYAKKPYIVLEHKVGSRYHNAGEHQKIVADQVEIGRDPKCEVRFDENFETVSRRHAAIINEGNNWKLVPLSHTNPSFVNGKIVHKEWYLQNGDEIQCAVNGPKFVFRIGTNDL